MKNCGIINVICVFILSIVLSACSLQKDINIKSIEILEETVPEFIVVGEFDKAGIKMLITYEDGTTEKIDVNTNLLKDSYQEYLNKAGEYEIEILFKGETVKLDIKMVDTKKLHVVKFFNGLNELVSMQFVEDGDDAIAPSKHSHLIEGYNFLGWDRNFLNVTEDIDVYGIYSKVNNDEAINYGSILIRATDNMRNGDLNILDVWELSSKRIETTLYYDELDLELVVNKVTEDSRKVNYNKYYKQNGMNDSIDYIYEKYDVGEFYSKANITIDEFKQYDIYGYVKNLISSTDDLTYSTYFSSNEKFYKLVAVIPNLGDGGYDSDEYEFLFNEKQIISLKHFLIEKNSVGLIDKILTSTKYYTVDLKEEQKIVFPLDVNLFDIVDQVFNNDVVITEEEMRDILVVNRIIKNNGDTRSALIVQEGLNTYIWDKDEATFYTKEELNETSSGVQVYKTNNSLNRYGKKYYYEVKNLSNLNPDVFLNLDGSMSFKYNVAETSVSRAHVVEFILLNNKLVEFKKYYYRENELIYIERDSLKYERVDIDVPSILMNNENTAIFE